MSAENPFAGKSEKKVLEIPPEEEFEQIHAKELIRDARSLDELLQRLSSIKGIYGTTDYFTSEDLIKIIEDIRKGEADLNGIPRFAGLREKVGSFVEAEKAR